MLTTQEWILIAVIVATLIAIVFDLLRADLVAIIVLAFLPLTGMVTYQEAFSGFSRSVVITIIGLFILTQALEETGVVVWIADRLRVIGRGSEVRLLLLFMATGAALSLVMNNIAAGAVLLPAAVQVGRESNVPPSKLLIPLAFGTLVGGMATYFTTANIIMSSLLRDQGQEALNMMSFLPTGGLIVIAALIFMALVGRYYAAQPRIGHAERQPLHRLTPAYRDLPAGRPALGGACPRRRPLCPRAAARQPHWQRIGADGGCHLARPPGAAQPRPRGED